MRRTLLAITVAVIGLGVGLYLALRPAAGPLPAVPGGPAASGSPAAATVQPVASVEEADPFANLSPDIELDPAKQDEIWLAEHITFELEQRLGKRFTTAWKARSIEGLEAMLRPGFSGRVPDGAPLAEDRGLIQQESFPPGHAALPVAASGWIAGMLKFSEPFQKFSSTSFRVLGIQRVKDQPGFWSCRVLLAAMGTASTGELLDLTSESDVTFFVPEDALQVDKIQAIGSWALARTVQLRTAGPMFREVTAEVGLDKAGIDDNWKLPVDKAEQYRFQMAVEDFDRDGWLDLAVAEKARSRLFRWNPETGQFQNVTAHFGIHGLHPMFGKPVDLAGWLDYDDDGFPDLVLGNRLYHNEAGRRFRDVTEQAGLQFNLQGMGVLTADYNADGRQDLYILYQASRESKKKNEAAPARWIQEVNHGEKNQLWKNLGNGRFENVTDQANAGGGIRHTLAGTFFHYDDDHFPDIYCANDFSTNVLLRNRGDGTFEDVAPATGTADFATTMGVAAGDTDNNGTSDLYIANMFSKMGRRIIGHVCAEDYPAGVFEQIQGSCAGNRLYRRGPQQQKFDEFGEPFGIHGVGWAYAPALADFDNDGWLDIYSTAGFLSFERGKPDG